MATPTYSGTGQPADNGGSWLGRFGSFLGGATPAYAGDGQPSSSGFGFFGGATPAYAPAPTSMGTADAEVADTCPIDPDALASGQIAIVIPRQGS
jgi:hypothetical protein